MVYDVLLTHKNKKVIAHIRQWPQIVAEADTEELALAKASADLKTLLTNSQIVKMEIDLNSAVHPWAEFEAMFADDPDWDEFQTELKEYRKEANQL